jgi:hypothetical protein
LKPVRITSNTRFQSQGHVFLIEIKGEIRELGNQEETWLEDEPKMRRTWLATLDLWEKSHVIIESMMADGSYS